MVKESQIALHVRVKLNSNFKIKSLSDEYLVCEPILFIADKQVYNDSHGKYVYIKGGSLTNSGIAYLDQIDLEFPITDKPLYSHDTINYNIKHEYEKY